MSNIEKATRVLSENWNNMDTNESLGRQRMLAQALADAGLIAPENPHTEWGTRESSVYVRIQNTEAQARHWADAEGSDVVRREVTEWEVAP